MRRKSLKQAAVFWILYGSYVSAYMARLNLSVAKPALERLGRLDTVQLAFLGSTFSLAYAVGKLINGKTGDRVRAGVMLSAGLFLTGAGNIVMGFLPPYQVMVLCWGLNAFGQSMLWGPILNVISAVYDSREAGRKATVIGTSIAVGNILGILAASFLINAYGPRETFMIPGVFAIALIPAVISIGGRREETKKRTAPPGLLCRKEIWTMILAALAQGAIKDNVALFMVDYFVKCFATDPTLNPLYVLLIPVSGLAGRMLYPCLYQRTQGSEYKVAALVFPLCALFAIPLSAGMGGAGTATICLCGIYAAASMVNTSFLAIYPLRFRKEGMVSSVSGIMDFCAYLGHAVSSAVYGGVIVRFGYPSMYASWIGISMAGTAVFLVKLWQDRKVEDRAGISGPGAGGRA